MPDENRLMETDPSTANTGVDAANTPPNSRLPAALRERIWQKGQSGNPSGRPKKKPVTEMYERILSDPIALKALEQAIKKALGKGQMAMVLQLREMTDRVEGKVTQPIEADITLVNLADVLAEARKRAGIGDK
jgi:uncharacterized protein DUF5681